MNLLVRLIISAVSVMLASYLLKGIWVENFVVAFTVAFVLSLFNTFLKPLLIILTIPISVFTFGLFLFFINALLVLLADQLITGFVVSNLWWAILFSFIVSVFNSLFGIKNYRNEE